jgi:hypothetical protein
MAVHLDPQLHHARGGAAVDHHIVHGQCVEHTMPVAHDTGMHQAAVVFLVGAAQHRQQRGLVSVQRDVGDEPQAPLVDADQRHAVARQLAADAQHRAVAAHHQAQVALAPMASRPAWRSLRDAHVGGGLALERHLAALGMQEMGMSSMAWRDDAPWLPDAMAWYLPISATWRNLDASANYITKMKSCSMTVPSC